MKRTHPVRVLLPAHQLAKYINCTYKGWGARADNLITSAKYGWIPSYRIAPEGEYVFDPEEIFAHYENEDEKDLAFAQRSQKKLAELSRTSRSPRPANDLIPDFSNSNAKLTKSFFMELPTGVYLVSRICGSLREPFFEETVEPSSERQAQWQRIKSQHADQRNCFVFQTEADHKKWLDNHLN